MTDIQISLTVISAVVVAVSAFGVVWLRVERAQSRAIARSAASAQEYLPFTESASVRRMEEVTHTR